MMDKLIFLKTVTPFKLLPDEVLQEMANLLQEVTYKKESIIYLQGTSKIRGLDIIVTGAYETFFYDSSQNKRLIEIYGEGTCFGGSSILYNRRKSIRTVIVKKGTFVYFLHRNDFKALCRNYEAFFNHFATAFGKRMLNDEYAHFAKPSFFSSDLNYTISDQLYTRRIETIESREIISCPMDTPICETARIMSSKQISCIFVRDENEKIIGYVTDIILRDKVVARELSVTHSVKDIIDDFIVSINREAFVYEAILLMFRTKSRYLLIEKDGEFIGVISRNKLLSDQAQSPFMFIQSVRLSVSVDELKRKWEKVPELVYQLLDRGVKAELVNQVITTVSDTIALKVVEGVIEELGPPPAKFVFMVLGSEGRKEQTLNTDQDNAIIYEDKANEQRELVREYFLKFADMVSDRLDNIGIRFCKGGFMAKNPKWTHSLSHWKRNYLEWMAESNPDAVMKFSTFFDCRGIYGEMSIIDQLKEFLNEELQKPTGRFFYFMAKNALQYEPTLTFFNNIRTFSDGARQVFDLKKTMTPIVDLVRVYSLKHRIFTTNTGERLMALREIGVFTDKEYKELLQTYYYLMGMRLKSQAMQIIHDRTQPSNYMDPQDLSKVEQVALKEIFKVIGSFQLRIKVEFTQTLLG